MLAINGNLLNNVRMITPGVLEKCNEELYVYDVAQQGWEQEHNGFTANMQHMLTHLIKDGFRKDFADPELVRTAVAPDNLMYGLRVARWAGLVDLEELASPIYIIPTSPNATTRGTAFEFHRAATDTVAEILHDEGHESEHKTARQRRSGLATTASVLLINSCNLHVSDYEFDIEESFMNRLASLRKRFDIPKP